ncbi:MAG: DUF2852 domain-containing protein [Paracoccaceae bacterium]
MTSIPMTGTQQDRAETTFVHAPQPIAVQILGLLLFGAFAIVTTVLAFVFFWPAGFVLAIILGWLGFGPIIHQRHARHRADRVGPVVMGARSEGSGNTTFDSYRAAVMERLEDEQTRFVSFLDRLRDAKDKSEFDNFMDDRARANRNATMSGGEDEPDAAKRGEY